MGTGRPLAVVKIRPRADRALVMAVRMGMTMTVCGRMVVLVGMTVFVGMVVGVGMAMVVTGMEFLTFDPGVAAGAAAGSTHTEFLK